MHTQTQTYFVLQCSAYHFEHVHATDGAIKAKNARNQFANYVPENHKIQMDEKKKERVLIDSKLSQKWSAKEKMENDIAQMQEKLKKINTDFKQNQQEYERQHKTMQCVLLIYGAGNNMTFFFTSCCDCSNNFAQAHHQFICAQMQEKLNKINTD